jgi:hypothetical protein
VVAVAQLVRASACGAEGRGFESRQPPQKLRKRDHVVSFFVLEFCYEKVLSLYGASDVCYSYTGLFHNTPGVDDASNLSDIYHHPLLDCHKLYISWVLPHN